MTGQINTYLIVTGATISIIKMGKLLTDYPINIDVKCGITGIQDGTVDTVGQTFSKLLINEYKVQHGFYVVNDDFLILYQIWCIVKLFKLESDIKYWERNTNYYSFVRHSR